MKRLLALLLLTLAGCASTTLVDRAPPAARQQERPLKPSSDVIWQDGHWAWDADAELWYWVSGTWASEQPGKIWIPGYWDPVETDGGRKWQWVEARWEDTAE